MIDVHALLAEYDESHRHPMNILIHWIFEPLAIWALLTLVWCVLGTSGVTGVVVLLLIYFAAVSLALGVGLALCAVPFVILVPWLAAEMGALAAPMAGAVLAVSLGMLFQGHRIEGNRPSVFANPHLAVIGPAWLLARVYRRVGLGY